MLVRMKQIQNSWFWAPNRSTFCIRRMLTVQCVQKDLIGDASFPQMRCTGAVRILKDNFSLACSDIDIGRQLNCVKRIH